MSQNYIFSSESVGEGHPDKVADTISDAVLDACLAQDKFSRVACETYVKSNIAIIGGEITTKAKLDFVKIARDAIREIGYVNDDDVFSRRQSFCERHRNAANRRTSRKAWTRARQKAKRPTSKARAIKAWMFGYACNETRELMPAPIMFAHRLGRELTRIRKAGGAAWLRPDAKSQVSVVYENGKPVAISNVVISTQHAADVEHAEIEKFCIEKVIKKVLPAKLLTKKTEFLINPTGRFVVGGPQGDTGLTGRKSSWTLTAAWDVTAAARSPAKTRRKLTAAPPTWAAGSRRTSWPLASRRSANSSSPTPSAILTRSACMSRRSARTLLRQQNHPRGQSRVQFPAVGHH